MIKFGDISFLYVLILVPFFIILFWMMQKKKKTLLRKIGDRNLIMRLTENYSNARVVWKFILLLTAFIFIVLTLIRVQIGSKVEKANRKGADIIIALDVSNSMLAEDIQPNRLARSKQAISKMIEKLEGDRIGIIIFAGKAFVQLPLTNDYAAAKMFLETISNTDVNEQGTAIGSAISMAVESFDKSQNKDNIRNNKAIIVITDGENHEDDAIEQAKLAYDQGIKISTIGMGLVDGAPIPVYNGSTLTVYKKDRDGNTVVTKLDETLLQKIAITGNGTYLRASNSNAGLQTIFDEIKKLDKNEYEAKSFSEYEDRFQYFAVVALILLLLELSIFYKKSKRLRNINLFGKK
ncbi:MAG: VWA domain-containing protein [Bacteroidetes bacterium]|nr:VWA domain-containing protein [Bacteroidota bacterium]